MVTWVRRLVRAAAGTALAAAVVLTAGPASAHATLETSSPAADSVLRQPPTAVTLRFSEGVTLLPTSLRVVAPNGDLLDVPDAQHAGSDESTATTTLPARLADGTYLVSWRVVSADSHPVSGAFTFSVGHRSAAPAATLETNDPLLSRVLAIARWAAYAGTALAVGGTAFLLWCWPAGWRDRGAAGLVSTGLGVLLVATFVLVFCKGAYDAGLGLSATGRVGLFREVLATTYGKACVLRLGLVGALWVMVSGRDQVGRGTLRGAVVLLGACIAVTFALAGHPAASDPRVLAVASDSLHVVAMSLWSGGLAVVLVALLRREPDDLGAVVARFSRVALVAVVTLVATGTYQSLRQVGSWGALLHTRYGTLLLVKLALVALTLLAAAGSRAWVWRRAHPPVVVHASTGTDPAHDVPLAGPRPAVLRRTVAVESLGLVAVLAVTSALVTTEPARSSYHPSVATTVAVGTARLRVDAQPVGTQRMAVQLHVLDADGRPTEPKQVTATVSLTARELGPLPLVLKRRGTGVRTTVVEVPAAGTWRLAVTVRTSAIDEATAYVDLPIS